MPYCFAAERLYFMNTVEKLGYLKGLLDGLGEDVDALADQVDEIDQDLADVEEFLADEDYCDCCDDEEDDEYCISCPNCGEEFVVDADTVEEGGVECPSCGEFLELGFVADDEDEEAPTEE